MNATPETCRKALKDMSALIDAELSRTLEGRAKGDSARLYNMLRYFMGYVDADFNPTKREGGKRFRPSLALLIADAYGAREQAIEAAVAIELFHNFTLIHDDVEDRDEYRRNMPTVWKMWGVNHAINSGDVQSLIAAEWVVRAARHPNVGESLATALIEAFIEVGEGQYLDFELTEAQLDTPQVTEAAYLLMIEKKSGALVRVAVEIAGIAAGKNAEERALLRAYGASLGMAYQIADDYRSVWTTQEETGKDAYSDIREHKRALPFMVAYAALSGKDKGRVGELYSLSRQLTEEEIAEVRGVFDGTKAEELVHKAIHSYVVRAKSAAKNLSIPEEARAILVGIIDLLIPEGLVPPA